MKRTQYKYTSSYLGAAFFNELLDLGYKRNTKDSVSNDAIYIIDYSDGENRRSISFKEQPDENAEFTFNLDTEYSVAKNHAQEVFKDKYDKGDLVVNTDQAEGKSVVRVLGFQRNSDNFTGVLEHTTRKDDEQYIGQIHNNYPKDAFEKYQGSIEIENV